MSSLKTTQKSQSKVVLLTPLILVLIAQLISSHQPCVTLYGLFNSLWLYTYVSLCSRGAAVLQEPLNKCYVIAIRFVNLCGIPLSKAVSADTLIAQVVTNNSKLFLYTQLLDNNGDILAAVDLYAYNLDVGQAGDTDFERINCDLNEIAAIKVIGYEYGTGSDLIRKFNTADSFKLSNPIIIAIDDVTIE